MLHGMPHDFSFLSVSHFSRHAACLAACRYLPQEREVPARCSLERFFVPNGLLSQATVELGIIVVNYWTACFIFYTLEIFPPSAFMGIKTAVLKQKIWTDTGIFY